MQPGRKGHVTAPMMPPMKNVIAASWNGGTEPLAADISASTDHMSTAVKPTSVADFLVIRIGPIYAASSARRKC